MNIVISTVMMGLLLGAEPQLQFERERIGAVTYEACSMFDVNNDGVTDIVSGGYWFPGPDFKTPVKIAEILRVDDYYDSFSDYPMDVNGDGWTDIVSGAWFGKTMLWRENPGKEGGAWKEHSVKEVGNIERSVYQDIDGDGVVEVFPRTQPLYIFKLDQEAGKGKGTFSSIDIPREGWSHGFGAGDINGDGKVDLLVDTGWLESTGDPFDADAYTFHGDWNIKQASVPILVHDVNGDGMNDVIVGRGHDYGLYWLEQGKGDDGARSWTKHAVEEEKSQFHTMELVDIDNDGVLELITGKRYRAHNGNDPGADEPLGLYYYELGAGKWARTTIDYGPADRTSGTGLYLWIDDIDGNGWKDILAPGKEGLYLFRNQGPVE